VCVWIASVVVRVLDLRSTVSRFDSRSPHFQAATLDKSFTHAMAAAMA